MPSPTTNDDPETGKIGTHEVMSRIRHRHADSGYAVLAEVGDSTGFDQSRRVDALVMSLWPSRGLELYGYEIKVSRADWLKELKSPAKAEAICRYCDRWWVACGDRGIVKPEELPSSWGLLEPSGHGLKIVRHAPKLDPQPLDRRFVAAIMRRCAEQSLDEAALKRVSDIAYEKGRLDGSKQRGLSEESLLKKIEELACDIRDFEIASGIKIRNRWGYDATEIGAAVKLVLEGKHRVEITLLQKIRSAAERILQETAGIIPPKEKDDHGRSNTTVPDESNGRDG